MKQYLLLLFLFCTTLGFGQSRMFVRNQETMDNTRKYADLTIETNQDNKTFVGANKYAVGSNGQYLKMASYELDAYNFQNVGLPMNNLYPDYSKIIYYPLYSYIKNRDFKFDSNKDVIILGGGRVGLNNRVTLLTKYSPTNNTADYSEVKWFRNGTSLSTGGVSIIPIETENGDQLDYFIGVVKDYGTSNVNNGVVLFIMDNSMNIIKKSYISDPNGNDISFNDVVQTVFVPNSELTTKDVDIVSLIENYCVFAFIGTKIDKNLMPYDAMANHTNQEILLVTDGNLTVGNSQIISGDCSYSKGVDITFDKDTKTLYALGHSSTNSFHISTFDPHGWFQNNMEYSDLISPSDLASMDGIETVTSNFQQVNGNTIRIWDDYICVAGYQEATRLTNDKLSHIPHLSYFDKKTLIPIYQKRYNTLYSYKFNKINGLDVTYNNPVSVATVIGEFAPNLLSFSADKKTLHTVFNSDIFLLSDIKYNTLSTNLKTIEELKCLTENQNYNSELRYTFENYTLNKEEVNFIKSSESATIIDKTLYPGLCPLPPASNSCKICGDINFEPEYSIVNNNGNCYMVLNINQVNNKCEMAGCVEVEGHNLSSLNLNLSDPSNSLTAMSTTPLKYKICTPSNMISTGTQSLFTTSGLSAADPDSPSSLKIVFKFADGRTCTNEIYISPFMLSGGQVPCPKVPSGNGPSGGALPPGPNCCPAYSEASPISNVSFTKVDCNNIKLCFDFKSNTCGAFEMTPNMFSAKDASVSSVSNVTYNCTGLASGATCHICMDVKVDLTKTDEFTITWPSIPGASYCDQFPITNARINVKDSTCNPISSSGDGEHSEVTSVVTNPGGPDGPGSKGEGPNDDGDGSGTPNTESGPRPGHITNNKVGIAVIPNPNSGEFTIQVSNDLLSETENSKIVIQDLLGRIVYSEEVSSKELTSKKITLKTVSVGSYLVTIIRNNKIVTKSKLTIK